MKILITGGAGFIGSHLAEKLVKLGHKVIVVDNLNLYYSPKLKLENIKALLGKENFVFEYGDIVDKEFLNQVFLKHQVEAVVHLAARAGVRHSIFKPLWYKETNITGTVNLLELAKQYEVKNFIFASSSSVYGEKIKGPFKEEDDTNHPVSPYAASKKAGEIFCYTYSQLTGLPVTVLRLFNVYGPRMRPELAMPLFAEGIRTGRPIIQYGDGTMRRSYTYIDDVVEGIILALEKAKPYRLLNLGSQETVSVSELIKTLEDIYGRQAVKKILPKPVGDVSLTFADSNRAKQALGWEPQVGFKEGCRRFVAWYEKHRQLADSHKKVYLKGITKKVLIFSLNYEPYMQGAELAVKEISGYLDHYDYALVCARLNRGLPKAERIGNLEVHRVGWGIPAVDKLFYPLYAWWRAWRLDKQKDFEIIWSIMDSYAAVAGALTKLTFLKKKFLISLFRPSLSGKQKMVWHFWSRLAYALVDRVHITTPVQIERVRRAGYKGQIDLALTGTRLMSFEEGQDNSLVTDLNLKAEDRVILSSLNNYSLAVCWELFSLLKKLGENFKLVLIVDKYFKDKLANKIKLFALGKRVNLVVRYERFNINELLNLADVFLVPSQQDNLPAYIIEAMMKKVLVVAPEKRGLEELLINRQTALLYEPGNLNQLVELVKQAVENKILRGRLTVKAYEKVLSGYDGESAAEKIKQVFDKI